MAEENGSGAAAAAVTPNQGQQIKAKIVSQFLKDLSFENPLVHKLVNEQGDTPTMKVEVNVGATKVDNQDDLYESFIDLKAKASNNLGTLYYLEIVYGGIFKIESIPEKALEPFLLISGPTMVFPFLRRLAADVTREGGFPPLLLDPIDFAGLYMHRKKQGDAPSLDNS